MFQAARPVQAQRKREPELTLTQEYPNPMTKLEILNFAAQMPREDFEKHPLKLAHKLPEIFSNKQFADIFVRIKAVSYPCHSEVMSLHSDLFSQVSNTPFRPQQEYTINLKFDVDNRAIKKLFDYCYTGFIESDFSEIIDILELAEELQIRDLVKYARCFLYKLFTPENVMYVVEASDGQAQYEHIWQVAREKLLLSFYSVCNTEEFLNWKYKQVEKFLAEDRLAIYTEFDPFQAIFRWINVLRGDRIQYLAKLMETVRFEFMSKRELAHCGEFDEVVNEHARVRELVADASWNQMMRANDRPQVNPSNRPKRPTLGDVVQEVLAQIQ